MTKIEIKTRTHKDQIQAIQRLSENFNNTVNNQKLKQSLILDVVCLYFGVTIDDLKQRSRKQIWRYPRQICCHLIRNTLNSSITFVSLGKIFDIDHATAIHSINKVQELIETNDLVRKDVLNILASLNSKTEQITGEELNKDVYTIDLNNCKSVKPSPERAIIYVGYTDEEIRNAHGIKETSDPLQIVTHKNTGQYIVSIFKVD